MEKISFTAPQVKQFHPVDDRAERMAQETFAAFEANSSTLGEKLVQASEKVTNFKLAEYDSKATESENFRDMVQDLGKQGRDMMMLAFEARAALAKFSMTVSTAKNFGQHFNSFLRGQ